MSLWSAVGDPVRLEGGRRAWLLLAVFALSWTLLEGVVGAQFQHPYHLLQIVWCRYAVHLLAVWVIWGRRHPAQLWRTQRPVFHVMRSLCMLVMPLGFAMALYGGMQMHTVWALFWMAPLLILVLARLWLRELVPASAWVAAVLGSASAVLLLGLHWPAHAFTVLWPLAMAASFAVYMAMTRQLRSEPVQTNLFHTAAAVFLLLTPIMPWVWTMPTLHDVAVLIAIGLVGLLGLWVLDRACEAAPVSATAPVLYLHLAGMFAIEAWGGSVALLARQGLSLVLVAIVLVIAWRMSAQGAPNPTRLERH
ncbi:MAG: DMT family transporter [Hydrogenophaga sp.]|uniref:DMT family transporter n=1 Tax=Hydrogenophaga sp. TaxID=1904254 RepID=UPI001D6724D6|nr:DMT family transporter [Hydrogenophaga sp.]MBX3611475.1 DMT family transporter [Hydrogenophaga sp.]